MEQPPARNIRLRLSSNPESYRAVDSNHELYRAVEIVDVGEYASSTLLRMIRFRGMQGALDRQGYDGRERKVLLYHPLGMFTTVLTRASSDVPTRSICLLR